MYPDVISQVYQKVSLADLGNVAKDLLVRAQERTVWLFYGEMGAGKTTLIKALGKALGIDDLISSPTFAIVNEYLAGARTKVYHFDFYRIKNEAEARDIGTEDYFYSGNYCLIEWPERIPSLIPDDHVKISIAVEDSEHRTIAISIHDGEAENRI